MPPVDAVKSLQSVDPGMAAVAPAPPTDSPMATARDAFSSVAGVTVRLLVSLPANLGQTVDQSA